MPTSYALRAHAVVKRYGKLRALDGLTVDIPKGSITGLIGPNGAGKTTAFSIFAGLIHADSGSLDILGMGPFDPNKHAGKVTVVPQDCELAPHSTVREILVHFARLQGMSHGAALRDTDRILERVGLLDRQGAKLRQLSHGMKRRVAVGQALLGRPELVLLDEPTNGLDPELVLQMRELILAQRGERTLIVSSHNLAELENVCDHVIFLQRGKLVLSGSLSEVTQRSAHVTYHLEAPLQLDLPGMHVQANGSSLQVEGPTGMSVADVNNIVIPRLLEAGARLLEVRPGNSLEQAYMSTRQG
ncbi:MAG: ABC transporter ATP-binding protein [Polyangiaceae bacterium]|nr:ABC transporter ATP-binding protein [Polyangiaceae bacterium]